MRSQHARAFRRKIESGNLAALLVSALCDGELLFVSCSGISNYGHAPQLMNQLARRRAHTI